MFTLAPFFTKIRGDFQVFDTVAQTMTNAGFWWQQMVNMSSGMSSECLASTVILGIELSLHSEHFLSEKTISLVDMPDFIKFRSRALSALSLFSKDSELLMLF